MDPEEMKFLALLVHRGHLDREGAERILPRLQEGEDLDDLLERVVGWEPDFVEKMRRTRGGEIPEIPGYEVLGSLGSGGTSDVFRVREKRTARPLALKVLRPDAARNAATRKAFIAEARMLETLEHPGLVKGYGVARSGTVYFNRLELVEGKTLLELLDEGRRFEEAVALRILLEAAEVLKYLGEKQVVHRDVKPGNIMLTANALVKLIDLGFAAGQDEVTSADESAVGTVAYLSPEQARGGAAADIRSDIYSLGVTLFQLLFGRLPFEGEDDEEVLRKQVMERLSSPELKSLGISPHTHYFIEKMMAKEVEVRYQSWDELIGDIRSQLEGRDSLDWSRGATRRPTPRRSR